MRDVITQPLPGQAIGITGWRGGFTEATVLSAEGRSNDLGGRWYVLAVRLPDGEVVEGVDTRSHVLLGPEYHETAWCPDCRSRQEVEDRHAESHMTAHGEAGYTVTDLSCGHSLTTDARIIGPAPGAPYAGPQVAVAASHRPRDLRAAQARQRVIDADPWGE